MAKKLAEFSPFDDLPKDFMCIIYGKRRTGKTTLLLHMLEQMKDRFESHKVHVFSGSANQKPEQWKCFPSAAVHGDLSTLEPTLKELFEEHGAECREEIKRQIREKMSGQRGTAKTASEIHTVEDTTVTKKRRRGQVKGKAGGVRATEVFEHNVKQGKHKGTKNTKFSKGRIKENGNAMKARTIIVPNDDTVDNEKVPLVPEDSDVPVITDEMAFEAKRNEEYDDALMPRKLFIFDDCTNDNVMRSCPSLNRIAVMGRHEGITVVLLSHTICGSGSVPPIIRLNSDAIILMYNPRAESERRLFIEQYLTPAGAQKDAGIKMLRSATSVPYRALVVDVANAHDVDFQAFLSQYGPVPEDPVSKGFQLGTPCQWDSKLTLYNKKPKFTRSDIPKSRPKPINNVDAGRFSKLAQPSFGNTCEAGFFNSIF